MRSINLGRWSRYIERYFNIKGGGGLFDVEQALRVSLPLQTGVEDRYLQSWNRFAVVALVGAVSAVFGRVRIRNPVGSNVIVVLEQVRAYGSLTDSPILTWGAVTSDLTTLVTVSFTRMDPRGNPQPTSIVSTNPQAAGGQAFLQGTFPANGTLDFLSNPNQEIPILPGQSVDMQSQIANQALNSSWMWRERAMEASELT